MPNLLITVEKAGAERLWRYILAYRRMISKRNLTGAEELPYNITLGVVLLSEQTLPVAKPKRNVKRGS